MSQDGKKHTKVHMTLDQTIDVDAFIGKILVKSPDGTVDYPPGWDDDAVAKKFGCTRTNVASVRKRRYGQLRTSPAKSDGYSPRVSGGGAYARIKKIEETLVALDAKMDEILIIIRKLM